MKSSLLPDRRAYHTPRTHSAVQISTRICKTTQRRRQNRGDPLHHPTLYEVPFEETSTQSCPRKEGAQREKWITTSLFFIHFLSSYYIPVK